MFSLQIHPSTFIIITMIWQALLLLLGAVLAQARVIEVTAANVQLVLRSGGLPMLLTHPQCPHSSAYAEKFIRIRSEQNLGIIDCLKDKVICEFFNITLYPTLLHVSKETVRSLDKDHFLLEHNVIE